MAQNLSAPKKHVLLYLLISAALLNVNKFALRHVQAPYCLTLLQMTFTWVLLLLAGLFGNLRLSIRDALRFTSTGVFWSLPLAFNMQVLVYLNPETAVMFRVLTLVGVAVGDWVYFGKQFKFNEIASIMTIITGAVTYVRNDLQFVPVGYLWGAAYWASMIVSLLFVKATFAATKDVGSWEKTTYLNMNGSIVLVLLVYMIESDRIVQLKTVLLSEHFGALSIWSSCVLGLAIGYVATITRDELSATAFDVLSNFSKFITILASVYFFKTKHNAASMCGLFFALTGGALYSSTIWNVTVEPMRLKLQSFTRGLF